VINELGPEWTSPRIKPIEQAAGLIVGGEARLEQRLAASIDAEIAAGNPP